ncbi:MAG: peptidylprolyl isomerase [bacterium]|nr:peptidylprolyl isomerase [bacterium]
MMQKMRENTKTILWVLIFAFLATIIFAWGMGGFDRKSQATSGVLAKVNGHKILQETFDRVVEQRIQEERERNGGQDLDENRIRTIRNEVWEQTINQILLQQELERFGIQIGDREVAFELRNNPPQYIREAQYFQKDGQFDQEKYEEFLRNPQAVNEIIAIENDVRERLKQQRLIDRITATAMVSDEQLWDEWTDKNVQFRLKYILFPIQVSSDDTILVKESEIEAEYQNRLEEFRVEEQRSLWYVSFPEKPSTADSNHAKELAEELYQRAKRGENFAELARNYSEDNSAPNGGDLGYFGRNRMVKPFEEVAFATPVDSIAPPVLTQFGWHVIKVTGRKFEPSKTNPKEKEEMVQASHILIKFQPSMETKDLVRDRARNFMNAALEKKDLLKVAKEFDVKIDTTGLFTKSGSIPKVGRAPLVTAFAFDSKIGDISYPYWVRNGWYVFGLLEIKKPYYKPYTDVRKQIQNALLQEKRISKSFEEAKQAFNLGTTLEDIAKATGKNVDTTSLAKAREYLPNIGRELELTVRAKTAPLNTLQGPVRGQRGAYLFVVTERTTPDSAAFASQKMQQINQIIQRRQQQLYNDYLKQMKDRAKIEDWRYLSYSDF